MKKEKRHAEIINFNDSNHVKKVKRVSSFPNEILLDILAFLDRRTLETVIRPTSCQFRALVDTMKKGPYLNGGMLETFAFFSNGDELTQHNLSPPPGDNAPTFRFRGLPTHPQFTLDEFSALQLPPYIRCTGLKFTMLWTADHLLQGAPEIPPVIAQLERVHSTWAYSGCEEENNGHLVPATNNSECMRQIFRRLLPYAKRLYVTFTGWAGMNIFRMDGINEFYKPFKIDSSENNRQNFELPDVVNWLSRPNSTTNNMKIQRNTANFNFDDLIPALCEKFENDTCRVPYYVEVHQKITDEITLTAEERALMFSVTNRETGETLSIYGSNLGKYFAVERRVAYE